MSFSFLAEVAVVLSGVVIDGRFRILKLLGEGDSAEVYRALDLEREHDVVIKLQRARMFESTATFRDCGALLADEEVIGKRLSGVPGVPGYVTRGHHGDSKRAYLAVDFIDGVLLREMINRYKPMYRETVVSVLAQLCEILVDIHGHNTIHQDLKPDNIMVDRDGRIWLFDFGISSSDDTEEYTGCGTPGYAAPEQYYKRHHRHQVDIYSLGAMLFEMLVMRLPYQDHPGRPEKDTEQFPADSLNGIPEELRMLGLGMVAFDQENRPAAAADVLVALRPMLPLAGSPAHPKAPRPDPAARYRLPR
jgi:eukaryotic-like serine/threonine-protein kinase